LATTHIISCIPHCNFTDRLTMMEDFPSDYCPFGVDGVVLIEWSSLYSRSADRENYILTIATLP